MRGEWFEAAQGLVAAPPAPELAGEAKKQRVHGLSLQAFLKAPSIQLLDKKRVTIDTERTGVQ